MLTFDAIKAFDERALDYDRWYDSNPLVFQSELAALQKMIPRHGNGIEIGVGTGRFAAALNVSVGIEPAAQMRKIAEMRGVKVLDACAEDVPFADESFDYVLFVTTLCFVQNPKKALQEAHRLLKVGGALVIGTLDTKSPHGQIYEKKSGESDFFRFAQFLRVDEIISWLRELGFKKVQILQTLFQPIDEISAVDKIMDGYGKGLFVVLGGVKDVRDLAHNR